MSKNLAPIPSRLPQQQGVLGAIGAANPLISAGTGPKTNPIIRYLAALRRNKWLVLFLIACGYGGGYLMSSLLRESYIVSANLQIAAPDDQSGPLQGTPAYTVSQWQDFMKRTRIVEPVVIDRRLYITGPKKLGSKPLPPGPTGPDSTLFRNLKPGPRFAASNNYELSFAPDGSRWIMKDIDKAGIEPDSGVVGDSIGRKFGFQWLPYIEPRWYGKTFIFGAKTVREAAEAIMGNLGIEPGQRFIKVTLSGQDKDITAGTLNDLLQAYVREALGDKRNRLESYAATYDSSWNDALIKLKNAERAVANFQTKSITQTRDGTVNTNGSAPGIGGQGYEAYIGKDEELKAAIKSRTNLETAYRLMRADSVKMRPDSIPTLISLDRFQAIPEVRNSLDLWPALQTLREQQKAFADLRKTKQMNYVVDSGVAQPISMQKLYAAMDTMFRFSVPRAIHDVQVMMDERINTLTKERDNNKADLERIPNRVIDENSLQRDLTEAAKTESIMREYQIRANMQLNGVFSDLSIDAPAVAPLAPNKNRKSVILALGVMLGLGAGLGIVFLLDLMDRKVRYADQVSTGLGLTILGVIPQIRRLQGTQTTVEEDSQVVEAFRTIRLNLAHASSDGKLTLTISSPAPSEGKSLVSSNLALSFAEAGYRTLLIDGDTRRGELHRTFGVDRRPGLIDYLADDHPLADLLRSTSHPLLQLMPSGSRKRNAPELLGSLKMRDLLAMYKEKYDVVIVDSPPLGAGIDPFVLGTLTGALMLVVRAGATQKDLAEAKLQVIDQLPIRLVGAVLNYVSSSTPLYRYYSYTSGYAAVDEEVPQTSLPAKKVEVKKVED